MLECVQSDIGDTVKPFDFKHIAEARQPTDQYPGGAPLYLNPVDHSFTLRWVESI